MKDPVKILVILLIAAYVIGWVVIIAYEHDRII